MPALWPAEERLHPRFYAGASLLVALIVANGALKRRVTPDPIASSGQ